MVTGQQNNNFNFWAPLVITKAKDKNGVDIMRLGGIASTMDEDSDGEFLDPKGFNIKPLLKSGVCNWHHMVKNAPKTIIGEPSKAEVRKEGLYVEVDLYPNSPVAKEVWDVAQILEKDSTTRRLGFSIEGSVVEKDKKNPKIILKADITGIAVTHMPKNPKTFANIIKGKVDNEEIEETEEDENETEKSLSTVSGAALKKESVDPNLKVLTKAETLEKIFSDFPDINVQKAKRVLNLIVKISEMSEKKDITNEKINKAYNSLGVEPIVKAKTEEANDDDDDDEEVEKKPIVKSKKPIVKKDDDGDEDDEIKKGDEPTILKGVFGQLQKAITKIGEDNFLYAKSLGQIVKAQEEQIGKQNSTIEHLSSLVKGQNDQLDELKDALEELQSAPGQRKSIAKAIDKTFVKDEEIEKGSSNTLSMSKDKATVLNLLDNLSFEKGYNAEFGKACMTFEAQGSISNSILSKIKLEKGITIVK